MNYSGGDNGTSRLMAFVAIILGAIATFLPFFKISLFGLSETISLWDGNYKYLCIIGFLFAIVVLYELFCEKPTMKRDTIILGILIVVEIVVQYTHVKSRLSELSVFGISFSSLVSPGSGFYMLAAAGILLFVSGFTMKN